MLVLININLINSKLAINTSELIKPLIKPLFLLFKDRLTAKYVISDALYISIIIDVRLVEIPIILNNEHKRIIKSSKISIIPSFLR